MLANGGSVSDVTMAAASTFCTDIDTAGIRDKFYRLNLFCGNQIAAALVPLYLAESRTASARGSGTDANNNFVAADFNSTGSSSGFTSNGTTKYLNTGLAANSLTANNSHFGLGLRAISDTSSYRTLIGAWNGLVSGARIAQVSARRADNNRNCIFGDFSTAAHFFGDSVNGTNLTTGNIIAAWPAMYRNGAASGTSATASADYGSAESIFVFALNNAGAVADYTSSRINWYSIGLTMTSTQASAFNTAIAAFNTTLSRT